MKSDRVSESLTVDVTNRLPVTMLESSQLGIEVTRGVASLDGDMTHRVDQERLIVEHLPTVRFIARRISERLPQYIELEELISAGIVGLIDAVQKFDSGKDVQFKSYAQFRIRGAILDSLRTLDWSPRDLRRKGRAVEEARRALTARLGRAPFEQEIARETGVTLETYQQLLGDLKSLEIGSLNVERGDETGEEELAFVAAPATENPLLQCMEGELRERLIAHIDTLPEKERLVLTLYYYEELTMKEIGLTLGVVESRISQLHASAVRRLKKAFGAAQNSASGKIVAKLES